MLSEQQIFTCEKCSDAFATDRALQLHLRTHTDRSKPFVCEICEKAFRHERNFVIHMQSHNTDHTYACNTCETGFSDFQSLKKHLVAHAQSWNMGGIRKCVYSVDFIRLLNFLRFRDIFSHSQLCRLYIIKYF